MKKVLLLIAVAISSFAAQADTVNVTFVTDFKDPAQPAALKSDGTFAFKGTKQIVFDIAGKTCTWVGSAAAIGPKGCNYWITADVSTGKLTATKSDSNPSCTPLDQLVPSCR